MKGIDYANTGYRRMYQPTPAFKLLGCKAQTVYWALRTVMDPSGFFKLCGTKPAEALAVELGWTKRDRTVAERGLEALLEQGWIHYLEDEDALFDPCFFESEHTKKSDKLRAKEYRQRSHDSKVKQFEERSRAARTQVEERSTRKAPLRAVAKVEPRNAPESERRIGFQASTDVIQGVSTTAPGAFTVDPPAFTSSVATAKPSPAWQSTTAPPAVHSTATAQPAARSKSSQPVTVHHSASRPVTERSSASQPVTAHHDASPYYLLPITQKQAAARDLASREGARARAAPSPVQGAAAATADPAFADYADPVAAIFAKAVGTARPFNPTEGALIADWFQRGIDLQVIGETIREKAQCSLKPVCSLLYFREPVQEAWARDRNLKACDTAHHDLPPIDFEARLETLEAMLRTVPTLAEQVAALRGQARDQPDQVETTLQTLEERFLDALELTDAQLEDLRRAMARLAKVVSADELARQQVRMARRIKREALGIPSLSLFSPEVSNPGPSQEVPT